MPPSRRGLARDVDPAPRAGSRTGRCMPATSSSSAGPPVIVDFGFAEESADESPTAGHRPRRTLRIAGDDRRPEPVIDSAARPSAPTTWRPRCPTCNRWRCRQQPGSRSRSRCCSDLRAGLTAVDGEERRFRSNASFASGRRPSSPSLRPDGRVLLPAAAAGQRARQPAGGPVTPTGHGWSPAS